MQNLSAKLDGWPCRGRECKEFWKPIIIQGMEVNSKDGISQLMKGKFAGVMEKATYLQK